MAREIILYDFRERHMCFLIFFPSFLKDLTCNYFHVVAFSSLPIRQLAGVNVSHYSAKRSRTNFSSETWMSLCLAFQGCSPVGLLP